MPDDPQPRLVALSGQLRGQTIRLSPEETNAGRSKTNDVHLSAPTVSRRHFLIRRKDSDFTILDLESSQGTFVNGIPVHERALASGDQISAGDSVLLFPTGGDPEPSAEEILAEDDDFPTGETQERIGTRVSVSPSRVPEPYDSAT